MHWLSRRHRQTLPKFQIGQTVIDVSDLLSKSAQLVLNGRRQWWGDILGAGG
jgi:hypothetical protein